MYKWTTLLLGMAVTLALPGAPRGEESRSFTVLDDDAGPLRKDFNRARGSVRLLFVVDPVCPGCLRGLDDINEALLSKTRDPRLQTFVVHVPVIGAEAEDVEPSMQLLQNDEVRHYWNPDGSFGRRLAEAVGLESADGELVYAWDVWLIYGPEATWEGARPPEPAHLMHQLRALQDSKEFPHLDRDVFAQEVNQLLAKLPPSDVTE
jgi:hypothetical protein